MALLRFPRNLKQKYKFSGGGNLVYVKENLTTRPRCLTIVVLNIFRVIVDFLTAESQ